jgi:hypothetical protein
VASHCVLFTWSLQDAHAADKVTLRKLEAKVLDAKDHTALAETAAAAKRQVRHAYKVLS